MAPIVKWDGKEVEVIAVNCAEDTVTFRKDGIAYTVAAQDPKLTDLDDKPVVVFP